MTDRQLQNDFQTSVAKATASRAHYIFQNSFFAILHTPWILFYLLPRQIFIKWDDLFTVGDRDSTVVKVLCYKSEGRWFDPIWCHWNFSLT